MLRFASLTAAAAALAFTPAAIANDAAEVAPAAEARPAKLVEFDGGWEVLKTSARLRVWRSHLAYKLSVDADGNPTDCELTEKFRRTYVNKKLCSVLLKTHRFEPARDASNHPVAGNYSNSLSFKELREQN